MLKQSLQAYTNRAITTHEVIEDLIRLAKDLRDAGKRGESLKLTDHELAF
jgi:type I restriction enzyme, R subunit